MGTLTINGVPFAYTINSGAEGGLEDIATIVFDATGVASQDVEIPDGYKGLELSYVGKAGNHVTVQVATDGIFHTTANDYNRCAHYTHEDDTAGDTTFVDNNSVDFGYLSGRMENNSVYDADKVGYMHIDGVESGKQVACFYFAGDPHTDEDGGQAQAQWQGFSTLQVDTNRLTHIRVRVVTGVLRDGTLTVRGWK